MSSEFRWAVGVVAMVGMLFGLPTIAPDEEERLRKLVQKVFQPLPRDMSTAESPVTPEKVGLGRALFFEPRISSDGTISWPAAISRHCTGRMLCRGPSARSTG